MDAKCTMKCQLTHVLPHKNKSALNIVQLSPEGEANCGGYIYQDAKRRGIYLALFTDQIQTQISWIKMKKVTFL